MITQYMSLVQTNLTILNFAFISYYFFQIINMRPQIPNTPTINLQILTWVKDSHGLYDYQSSDHHKQYFKIQGPCKMFRNWLSTQTCLLPIDKIKRGHLPEQSYSFLASIILKHNGNYEQFILNTPEKPSQQIYRKQSTEQPSVINTHPYIVVKFHKDTHKDHGYMLKPGNILKIGRVQFKAVEIGGLPKHRNIKQQNNFLDQFNGVFEASQKIIGGTCKFCLGDDDAQDNFLISPCNCKGSCQGVHVQCLKMWIDSKVKKQVNGVVVTYNFTKFQCEICKIPFPRMVIRNNFRLQMITIDKPEKPYIILQGINQRKQSKQQRCLHVICPEDGNNVKIGRGHQCQIRLQDISVSRMHSQIKYAGGQFYVSDQNSKFGTLIRLDKPTQLIGNVKLQIGRSLYEFQSQ